MLADQTGAWHKPPSCERWTDTRDASLRPLWPRCCSSACASGRRAARCEPGGGGRARQGDRPRRMSGRCRWQGHRICLQADFKYEHMHERMEDAQSPRAEIRSRDESHKACATNAVHPPDVCRRFPGAWPTPRAERLRRHRFNDAATTGNRLDNSLSLPAKRRGASRPAKRHSLCAHVNVHSPALRVF